MATKLLYFHYDEQNCKVSPLLTDKINSVFKQIQENFKLPEKPENYLLLCPFPVEISSKTVEEVFKDVSDGSHIHVLRKDDYSKLTAFCNDNFHIVRFHALTMYPQDSNLLRTIHNMHRRVQQIYNCKYDFSKSIPNEVYANKQGIQLIDSLNKWFSTFMSWPEQLKCQHCNGELKFAEYRPPTKAEKANGAAEVERFYCPHCKSALRLPIYEDPINLFNTIKKGYSTEFCVLFGAILRSFNFHVRLLRNLSINHFWLEVYVQELQRYVFVDPVCGTIDTPYNRNIVLVVAVGLYECCNVTYKYSRNASENPQQNMIDLKVDKFLNLRNQMWSAKIPTDQITNIEQMNNNDKTHVQENPPEPAREFDSKRFDITPCTL